MGIYTITKQKVKNEFFTVRVEKGELAMIDKVAAKLRITRSDFVSHAVKKELTEAASKLFR